MKSDMLINQARKIPEIETELNWYLNTYIENGNHPWHEFLFQLNSGINILLPAVSEELRHFIIVLTVLVREFDLKQGDVPGTYRIFVEEYGYLDELDNLPQYLIYTFCRIVEFYYQANDDGKLRKLGKMFKDEVHKWNSSEYVVQERVKALAEKYPLHVVAEKLNVPVDYIPIFLSDYYSRIKKKRLENLEGFLHKVDKLFESNPNLNESAKFFNFIVGEVKNGGLNLNSSDDILPHFSGLKYN